MKVAFFLNLVVQLLFISLVFVLIFMDPIYEKYLSPKVLGKSTEKISAKDPCVADIHPDGAIDDFDYAEIKMQFLNDTLTKPSADVNSDGIVDLTDFSILSANY